MPMKKNNKAFLTRRQYEALVLLTDGLTNIEAADVLFISVKTFEKHRAEIIRKFGTPNLALITKLALKKRLIKL